MFALGLLFTILSCSSKTNFRIEESFKNGNPKFEVGYSEKGEINYNRFYYPNGTVQKEGPIKNGKRTGEWKAYYKNGALWSVGTFENDKRVGSSKTFYPNTQLQSKGEYKDGKQFGKWIHYDTTGTVINTQEFN